MIEAAQGELGGCEGDTWHWL